MWMNSFAEAGMLQSGRGALLRDRLQVSTMWTCSQPVGRGSARAVAGDDPKAKTASSSHGSDGASPYRP